MAGTVRRLIAAGLTVTAFLAAVLAAADHHPATTADDVEVMRRGGVIVYRYRDENGRTIVVDRPPPFYFDSTSDEALDTPEAPVEAPPPVPPSPPPPPEPRRPTWWPFAWSVPALMLALALGLYLRPVLQRWRSETTLDRTLRRASLPVFHDLKLSPDGRRQVVADRVVRLPTGLLVLVVADLNGDIRGATDADHWLTPAGPILNPLKRLQQAVAAVEHFALQVPVDGKLVVRGQPKFHMALPSTVQRAADVNASFEPSASPPAPDRALDTAWRTLMRFPRSNEQVRRPGRGGASAWLARHIRELGVAALVVTAAAISLALLRVPAV